MSFRVGSGWDIHKLETGRKLVIGGVEIPNDKGCVGHSDGDALLHAIIDAMFGAAGLADIGTHFPDTDPAYKDISSVELLKKAHNIVKENDWQIVNVDSNVILQSPKLMPYMDEIKNTISNALDLDRNCVGVKAKTAEHMLGELGESNAVMAQAVVLLEEV